jgi:hypothetical protein
MLKFCIHCGKSLKSKFSTELDEEILRQFNLIMCGSFTIEAFANFLIDKGFSQSARQGARSSARAILARASSTVFKFGIVVKEPNGRYRIKALDNAVE